ncbi:uncharacterized protein [Panulirus ornatus]|uniref:uncharacterized protein n=1 Tax=Panulirus ornatus TaxID=150431 RepID=UPI003A8ABAD9
MKRQRGHSSGDDVAEGRESKKCVMRRAGGGHGEQRSGVVTVIRAAAAFKPRTPSDPDASSAAAAAATTSLSHLRSLAPKVLTSSASVSELIDYASKKFLSSPSHSCWDVECEMVVTILYMAVTFQRDFTTLAVKGIVAEFFERWLEDAKGLEFQDLVKLLKKEWMCTASSTLFLLYANLVPDDCDISVLKDSLSWSNCWLPEEIPPSWLLNATASTDLSAFSYLLLVSAIMRKGDHLHVDCEDTYVGSTIKFLSGVNLYKKGEFEGSIKCLQTISSEKCGADVQGWILWLTGLILFKVGKPHTALLKLQAAVDKCERCIPAIFNISRIFFSMDLGSAELETLSLLIVSLEEKDPYSPVNLQSSILALHHHSPDDLQCRVLYLLASRCLQMKMYAEAVRNFTLLLEKLENLHQTATSCSRSIFRPEDDIPELPSFVCIQVLAAVAHMGLDESENIAKLFSQFGQEDLGSASFYRSSCERRILCITAAVGTLLKVEALAKIGNVTEALQDCIRLEHETSWVRGTISNEWDTTLLLFKTLLYRTLSDLHGLKKNKQNQQHYKRLSAQCSNLLTNENIFPTWTNLSLSKKLVMDNIYFYMKEKI